jgi:hypothetical protein
MKNIAISVLLALITMSAGFSDSAVTFNCTQDPNQVSQDFQFDTLSFSLNQSASGISFVAGSLVSVPAVDAFKVIDSGTKVASDLNGTPATDVNQILAILGNDTNSKLSKAPQQEAHLLCTQAN